jgi:hypothetical protein
LAPEKQRDEDGELLLDFPTHPMRVECTVMTAVPVFRSLAFFPERGSK